VTLDRSELWFERLVEPDGRPEPVSPTYSETVGETIPTKGPEGSLTLPFAPIYHDLGEEGDETEWTWDGFVAPGSITAVCGWPKVGKTTLLLELLAAIAGGEPFLERETRKSGILLLTEERKRTLVPKLRARALPGVHRLRADQAAATPWARIGEHVGQRNLAVTANTYTHVLSDETELDYERLMRARMVTFSVSPRSAERVD
jgi:AAA domain